AVRGVVDGAIGAAKNFLGINSPSRLFREEIGQMVGRGMADGIEGERPNVAGPVGARTDAAARAGDTAIKALQTSLTKGSLTATVGVGDPAMLSAMASPVASTMPAAPSRDGNAPGSIVVQGPLVEVAEMVVDDENRVKETAQELWARANDSSRANGVV